MADGPRSPRRERNPVSFTADSTAMSTPPLKRVQTSGSAAEPLQRTGSGQRRTSDAASESTPGAGGGQEGSPQQRATSHLGAARPNRRRSGTVGSMAAPKDAAAVGGRKAPGSSFALPQRQRKSMAVDAQGQPPLEQQLSPAAPVPDQGGSRFAAQEPQPTLQSPLGGGDATLLVQMQQMNARMSALENAVRALPGLIAERLKGSGASAPSSPGPLVAASGSWRQQVATNAVVSAFARRRQQHNQEAARQPAEGRPYGGIGGVLGPGRRPRPHWNNIAVAAKVTSHRRSLNDAGSEGASDLEGGIQRVASDLSSRSPSDAVRPLPLKKKKLSLFSTVAKLRSEAAAVPELLCPRSPTNQRQQTVLELELPTTEDVDGQALQEMNCISSPTAASRPKQAFPTSPIVSTPLAGDGERRTSRRASQRRAESRLSDASTQHRASLTQSEADVANVPRRSSVALISVPAQPQEEQRTGLAQLRHQWRQFVEGKELLLPDSDLMTTVDCLFLITVLLESFEVGVHIGANAWDHSPSAALTALFAAGTVVATLWMVLRFRLAVLNAWELIDSDGRRVAHLYMRWWFPFDVLHCIPFDLICLSASSYAFRVLACLRLLRIARMRVLFRSSNPLLTARPIRGLLMFSYYLLGHHGAACLWMLLAKRDDHYNSWQLGMYWAVQTTTSVGYGDLSDGEDASSLLRWYTVACMACGVIGVSYFISVASVQLLSADVMEAKVREKKQKLNSLMVTYAIPWEVQKEAFVLYPSMLAATTEDFAEVIQVFPTFMQEKIGRYVRTKLLRTVPMFRGAERECVEDLADCMEEDIYQPHEYIMKAGEIGREMFFLAHGVVEVLVVDQATGEEKQVVILRDGSWFGEIAVLKETTRTASVRTITVCDLFCLGAEDFQRILAAHPESNFEKMIRKEVDRRIREATAQAAVPTSPVTPGGDSRDSVEVHPLPGSPGENYRVGGEDEQPD
eukprot:TRINITY_DN20529_c0_g1_i1.p1 TRINITY_DN20529_c0_g1~~TRINITY_DN20529_c0_g1_i1.p1  ORF type:complete len:1007 (+),score=260.35 TRINITY_DN20529_c0_g1_i1:119-3022(+)